MMWNIRKQKTTMQNSEKKKDPKNEDSINSLWGNFKRSNICITGVQKRKNKKLELYLKK